MDLVNDASENYFKKLCIELLGTELLTIVKTDSYLRQPCYSSRAREFYYIVIDRDNNENLIKIKYIQGEFPEFFLNYLTKAELVNYPAHGKWQFVYSPIIYSKNSIPLVQTNNDESLLAIKQAIFGIGHIARLYYLRDMDDKTHTWAVRQLGWAIRYTESGILKLWNKIVNNTYLINEIDEQIKGNVDWLIDVNENWRENERLFLSSKDEYKKASVKINNIVEFYASKVAAKIKTHNHIADSSNDYDSGKHSFIQPLRDELISEFGDQLQCFYLHGSAARGDQHQNSDVDSMCVFSTMEESTLKKLKSILEKYPNTSISTFSVDDISTYPNFRKYALNLGLKKVYGEISFRASISKADIIEGILNNLYTILQVSRTYLLSGSYGPRAPYMLKLMLKLADHGCLRLIYQYQKETFPNTKEEVKLFFKHKTLANQLIDYVIDINNLEINMKKSLLVENTDLVSELYVFLLSFVSETFEEIKMLNGNSYEKSKL